MAAEVLSAPALISNSFPGEEVPIPSIPVFTITFPALNHAAYHKMDRVFYIIPFTSIIDQNADEVRKILEDKDDKDKKNPKTRLKSIFKKKFKEYEKKEEIMTKHGPRECQKI